MTSAGDGGRVMHHSSYTRRMTSLVVDLLAGGGGA